MATILVRGGDNLQTAINNAVAGDVLELEANASFMGPFTLPNKAGSSHITIRSQAHASLPVDTRVAPSQSTLMPKILTNLGNVPAITTAPSAHHYTFIGIEFAPATAGVQVFNLVELGDGTNAQNNTNLVPHNLILDRCYIHGLPTSQIRRGVALNSSVTTIKNCYISDIHMVGFEAQAICGWNGLGTYLIENNYLEGAGENVMFGGATGGLGSTLSPDGIQILRNHIKKPLSWYVNDPSYAGIHWAVKNIFELKHGKNILIEGNLFEGSWIDGQIGFAIVFTPRPSDSGSAAVIEDVIFRNNLIRNAAGGITMSGTDDTSSGFLNVRLRRVQVLNNVWENISAAQFGGNGRGYQIVKATEDVTIDHNTMIHDGTVIVSDEAPSTGFVFKNNISRHNSFGVFGSGVGIGQVALDHYFPGHVFTKNALAKEFDAPGNIESIYTADNFFPTTLSSGVFVDFGAKNYRIHAASPLNNAATDGTDVGCDIDALEAALSGDSEPTLPAPTITTVSPASGPTTGGTTVSIAGTNFQQGATVTFGGTAATGVVVNTTTSITAVTPAKSAGAVTVVVTNPDTQSGSKVSGYTYVTTTPTPTLILINPSTGPTTGGTSFTVTGTGFTSGMTISIGGVAATNVAVQSSTSATGLTPPHAAGAVNVVATNTDGKAGTLVSGFTYVEPPPPPPPPTTTHTIAITSTDPNSGVVVGTDPLDLNGLGTGLTPFTRTYNKGANALVRANSPAHNGNTFVKWQRDGADWSTNVDVFYTADANYTFNAVYQAPAPPPPPPQTFTLTVSSSPSFGVSIGVSPVDNNSQGNGSTVFTRTYNENTAVTVTAPSTSGGNVFKHWLKAGSIATTALGITVIMEANVTLQAIYEAIPPPPPVPPAPVITSIVPSKGSLDGGLSITITGTGFQAGATVTFGGVAATEVQVISGTSIRCVNPARAIAGKVNVVVTNTDGKSATQVNGFQYQKNGRPKNTMLSPNGGLIVL